MKILFQTYWGIDDGLTQSTVYPNISQLAELPNVSKIILSTIERDGHKVNYTGPINSKIFHNPRYSKKLPISVLNKIFDFIFFSISLIKICKKEKIDYIIGRGALAGALSLIVGKITKIPVVVESFEPHAQYMLESGVWSKKGLKYKFGTYWENKIKKDSYRLITVSNNYKNKLISQGIKNEKIEVVPCCVNILSFKYNIEDRLKTRLSIGINNSEKVGIYVGKFGGIYYDIEAFDIFAMSRKLFNNNLFLIILTPENIDEVRNKLKKVNFPLEKVFIDKVAHYEVPRYLSAADFAFSTIKPAPSRIYCSAIKNGEYWASGLPILMTEGVGDDTEIILNEGGGFIFNVEKNNLEQSLQNLKNYLEKFNREDMYHKIYPLALKHRNFEISKNVYKKIFGNN